MPTVFSLDWNHPFLIFRQKRHQMFEWFKNYSHARTHEGGEMDGLARRLMV
jgi:hypothetical protein